MCPAPLSYPCARAAMEERVEAIVSGSAGELVWLVEHPSLLTAGVSTGPGERDRAGTTGLTIYDSNRGGKLTWHGPGQRVAYVMLDLRRRGRDVRHFVATLGNRLTVVLADFGLTAVCPPERVGVWVRRTDRGEDKIAALGIRLRHWVSFHGIALNVAPDLSHYHGFVACGIDDPRYGVTSLRAQGSPATLAEVDAALRQRFGEVFQCRTVDEHTPVCPQAHQDNRETGS